jgi:hypothetical protein
MELSGPWRSDCGRPAVVVSTVIGRFSSSFLLAAPIEGFARSAGSKPEAGLDIRDTIVIYRRLPNLAAVDDIRFSVAAVFDKLSPISHVAILLRSLQFPHAAGLDWDDFPPPGQRIRLDGQQVWAI